MHCVDLCASMQACTACIADEHVRCYLFALFVSGSAVLGLPWISQDAHLMEVANPVKLVVVYVPSASALPQAA